MEVEEEGEEGRGGRTKEVDKRRWRKREMGQMEEYHKKKREKKRSRERVGEGMRWRMRKGCKKKRNIGYG